MLVFLRANDYQYGAGSVTVVHLSSRKLGAFNFDTKVERRGKERFLKDKFSLAGVDGLHRRLRTQKLAPLGQLGTGRALRLLSTTLIKALKSEVLTDCELSKLSSSANKLLGLVFRGPSVTAVMEVLV